METTQYIQNNFAIGMNCDQTPQQLQAGQVLYAQNAVVENFDGNGIVYQNEPGNEQCFKINEGYQVIGVRNIIEQDKTIFFLTNPANGSSEIGILTNATFQYSTLINGSCLNFHIDHPIKKVIVKSTNCSNQLFFTDGYNPVRWIDLNKLPFKNGNDSSVIDCNKLLLQPDFAIPVIKIIGQLPGGSLKQGSYQFCIQYANSKGEGYSSFYSITGPASVFQGPDLQPDQPTSIALSIRIENLDSTDLFEYFNLAVLSTVAGVTTPKVIGTFRISGSNFDYTYSGNSHSEITISMAEIFERFPYYSRAKDITTVDNTLFLADVSTTRRINYQRIWSNVKLNWETWRLPYNRFEGYYSASNVANLRGYLRDEIYCLEGCFLLRNGQYTDSFHIPGRVALPSDLEVIDNTDAASVHRDSCSSPEMRQRWQVYNTATFEGFSKEYLELLSQVNCIDCNPQQLQQVKCYKGPYQYGTFSYWQSTLKYPSDKDMWGELAGEYIRHHKMPDCAISPIYSTISADEYVIFPMGIKVDAASLYSAIYTSDLSAEEKSQIVGFKITRTNRASNQSIVAKGLLYNVGEYSKDGQKRLFPNYPYGDLHPDVFLSGKKVTAHSGGNPEPLNGFTDSSRSRYTFHSPDTSFVQPFGVDAGFLNLETIETGKSQGHFIPVKENAQYKFLTRQGLYVAFATGLASMVSLDTGGGFMGVAPSAKVDAGPVPAVFSATLEMIKNIAPWTQYGYQYTSIGTYNKSVPVHKNGSKVRAIRTGAYISPGNVTIDGELINNYQRESSIFLKLMDGLPFPHENGENIIPDDSRVTPSIAGTNNDPSTIISRNICAYYGAIKRFLPDQYGEIYSGETIDTGYYHPLFDGLKEYEHFQTVFGGDTFINRFAFKRKLPFFLDHTVGRANGTDIDQDLLSNVAYPAYYYSTRPIDSTIDFSSLEGEVDNIINVSAGNIIVNVLSGGIRPVASGLIIMSKLLQAYIGSLGIANTNLEGYNADGILEKGRAFLFAYGIPWFFTESAVNVDLRMATNEMEGNFFPHVSENIPDDWLQESRVSIINDNKYLYDDSYSKQIKEVFLSHLPPDYGVGKKCQQDFPNRIIFSEKENLEAQRNNWLIFRPASYFDTPKSYGNLNSIDGLEDRKILARFSSKSLLYNVLSTINTSSGQAFLGDPNYFSNPGIDFAESDAGFNGSQHVLLIRTPVGHLSVDAIRGQIFLIGNQGPEEISGYGMRMFFSEHLPFVIQKYFPTVDTDNCLKNIGLTGCYDYKYRRFLITKKDYQPLKSGISFSSGKFMFDGKEISLNDPLYFCDRSWTLSYHTGLKKWISFHSYVPNYYLTHPDGFLTGIKSGVYDHRGTIVFNKFYENIFPYILEYPIASQGQEQILGAVSSYTTVRKYSDRQVYAEPGEDIFFDEAVIYNDQQCSGKLLLIPRPTADLSAFRKFPRFLEDGKEILFTKKDGITSFNTFWDVVKLPGSPFYRLSCNGFPLKIFDTNLDYSPRSFQKFRMRGKQHVVRLSFKKSAQYHLATHFNLAEIQKSIT